jgi:hypothetical protein
MRPDDPVERVVFDALTKAGLPFTMGDQNAHRLDFHLTALDVAIEVKQFHTERIAEQMSRHPNVIAIQGIEAARAFAEMIKEASDA